MERTVLRGLTAAHFICPEEKKMREEGVLEKPAIRKLLQSVGAATSMVVATRREGTYVRLTPDTHRELFRILRDVCRILDCPQIPDLYVIRLRSPAVVPCGGTKLHLVISTFTLETYDEDMLYYAFGNAMAMVKAGHVEISEIMGYMPGGAMTAAPKAVLLKFIHAADMSSDRGGLLACQSFAAAVRCHLLEVGMPPSESRKLFSTDAEAAEFVGKYLAIQKVHADKRASFLTKVAKTVQDLSSVEAPGNQMLRGMYQWYTDPEGYSRILKRAKEGRL